MNEIDLSHLQWFKSSRSSANSQSVVCARLADGGMAIRDSKLAEDSPVLFFTHDEWVAFTSGVRMGEFD